jgi:hypothetical protein
MLMTKQRVNTCVRKPLYSHCIKESWPVIVVLTFASTVWVEDAGAIAKPKIVMH